MLILASLAEILLRRKYGAPQDFPDQAVAGARAGCVTTEEITFKGGRITIMDSLGRKQPSFAPRWRGSVLSGS